MAQATVFVDDAVRGRLPPVCAKTGVPTTDQLRVRGGVGDRAGFGVAWLLVLAGPIGWIGLVIMAFARSARAEELEVRVPLSEPAYQHLRACRRRENLGFAVVVLSFPVALVLVASSGATLQRFVVVGLAGAFIAGVALLVVGSVQHGRARVSVDLDASRRWVRLGGVHPAFAAACEHTDRERDRV